MTSRSVRRSAVAAVLVVGAVVLGTGTAHAGVQGHVSGTVSCVAGQQVIAWNYSSNGQAGDINSANMSGAATGAVTMTPSTLTAVSDEANGSASVSGTATGVVTLTVVFTPNNMQPITDTGDVTLPGGCLIPTTTSTSSTSSSSSSSTTSTTSGVSPVTVTPRFTG